MFYANAEGQFQTRLIALFIFAKGARVHVRILVVSGEGADWRWGTDINKGVEEEVGVDVPSTVCLEQEAYQTSHGPVV